MSPLLANDAWCLTAALLKQASGRALSYLFGTARPLTCILWKRPQHKPTLA